MGEQYGQKYTLGSLKIHHPSQSFKWSIIFLTSGAETGVKNIENSFPLGI